MERRSLLKWLFYSVSALWGLGISAIISRYLKQPEVLPTLEANLIDAGLLQDLQIGVPKFLPHAREPVWVMRLQTDEVMAVSAICTHFHCIVRWDPEVKVYQCPCHRGSFDRHGNVLAGPPPAPLPKPRVEVRQGEVYVHLT